MRTRIGWVSNIVRDLLREANEAVHLVRPIAKLGVEKLEDRLALSANLPTPPTLQGINLTVPGDSYSLAGTTEPTAYSAVTKWNQPNGYGTLTTITYSYSNLLDGRLGLSAGTLRAAIQEAMSRWAAVAPLRFVEVPDSGVAPSSAEYNQGSGAMIRFGHLPIDGASNVLAYGYYPGSTGLAGDIIFDEGETWSTTPNAGRDILEVAEHELGHALGLGHQAAAASGGVDAIMNPYYGSRFHGLGTSYLLNDDIAGIRSIYGTGTGAVVPYDPTGIYPNSNPNPFTLSGTTLYVTGTAGADLVVFTGTGSGSVSINGVSYTGSLASVRSLVIDSGGGADKVTVTGSSSAETYAMQPNGLTMTGPKWNVTVINAPSVVVYGGAEDVATFVDSAGVDCLVATPTVAELTGTGYSSVAWGVGTISAQPSRGGRDLAFLYGSAGSDYFVSTPSMASLKGTGFSITATNFHTVWAYASGGSDSATLGGSAGVETSSSAPGYSWLQANNGSFATVVVGFTTVAIDGGAGNNVGYLTGSIGNDTLSASPSQAALNGSGFGLTMTNFQSLFVNGGGGSDTARLTDSAGADNLVVMAGSMTLSGVGYSIQVDAFVNATVTSVGGQDRATIYDSAGSDTLTAGGQTLTMAYPGIQVQVTGFENASVRSAAGGTDKKKLSTTTFILDFVGTWA